MNFNKEYKEQLNRKLVHFCAFDYFLFTLINNIKTF
jgi:hypothetical protein